jgi:hypothetical protein
MKQALQWSTVILLCAGSVQTAAPDVSSTPQYTKDNQLLRPGDYRSGFIFFPAWA